MVNVYGNSNKLFKTSDGGKTWINIPTPLSQTESFLNEAHFWSLARGILIGDPRDGYFEIYQTFTGGQAWQRISESSIPSPLPDEFGIEFLLVFEGNSCYFATTKGRVFTSHDAGAHWTASATGLPMIYSLTFSPDGIGIVSNWNWNNKTKKFDDSPFKISRDSGKTWKDLKIDPNKKIKGACYKMKIISPSNYILASARLTNGVNTKDTNNAATYLSRDLGKSWEVIARIDWVRVPTQNVPTTLGNEIGFNEIYQVSGDTIWFSTSIGRVYRSVNRGQNWQAYESPFSIINVLAFSKGHGLGLCFENYILGTSYATAISYTTNGGVTWPIHVYNPFNNQFVFDATFVPESDYIIVTTGTDLANGPFKTYLSQNSGTNWTQIDNQAPIVKVKFVSPRVGYGGGHKNSATTPSTLYRYTSSPLMGLLTPSVLDAQISLSPNPTTDQINIQLTYKEASSFRLNINNLLGELVYSEDFKDVSTINKSLDIKHLPSGTYIVTIANPTGSLSRKFVKTE